MNEEASKSLVCVGTIFAVRKQPTDKTVANSVQYVKNPKDPRARMHIPLHQLF